MMPAPRGENPTPVYLTNPTDTGAGAEAQQVQGVTADGGAVIARPLLIGGVDSGGVMRHIGATGDGDMLVWLIDHEADTGITISPFGALKIAEMTRLIGGNHEGNTIDSRKWSTTTANGGTVTIGSGLALLRTNTTANGSTRLYSTARGAYFAGINNAYLAGIRVGDTGVANNVRRWGVFDDTNGLFFELNGTSIRVARRQAGVDEAVASAGFNGTTPFVLDTNFHIYEIIYGSGTARFYQDRRLIHRLTTPQSSLCDTISLKLGAETTNSEGGTSDALLYVRGSSISRFGREVSRPTWYQTTTNETVVLKREPGTLHRVVVGNKGTGSATVTLYDNTAASGTIIGVLDLVNTLGSVEFNLDFNTGLTIVTTATVGDITVVWS